MKPILLVLGLYLPMLSGAQILYSNGAQLVISPGAIVTVNGGTELAGTTVLNNAGTLKVTKNSTFPAPGNFQIDNGSSASGSGSYAVEQDWINNGIFTANSSTVTLFGNTRQYITSQNATPTTFNNLILTGTGTGNDRKKTLQLVNSATAATGVLNLNDRELETQANNFSVLNPATSAIAFDVTFGNEGFVSSTPNGYLIRMAGAAGSYVFPTGSSAGTQRFRPVTLTFLTANSEAYGARLNNYDSNTDGFSRDQNDGTTCNLNDKFYHSIERLTGSAPADVTIAYLPADDGDWTGISQWYTSTSLWTSTGVASSVTSGNYTLVTQAGWNFDDVPYILNNVRPATPTLDCPTICENSAGNIFVAQGTTSNYQWTFPGNGTIVSGQGTSSVAADWTTGTGTVSVVAVDASGCSSLPATCDPVVLQGPDVQFTYTSNDGDYAFSDNTAGAVSWAWDFGDGTSSASADPAHTFYPGTGYSVSLTVVDGNGCTGTETQLIEYFKEIVIPNVITPNNDGTNDIFLIDTPPTTSYDITIVNRWGNVVYHNTDPAKSWDGKLDGSMVTDGVYFYVLKLSTNTQDYRFEGNVSVFQH